MAEAPITPRADLALGLGGLAVDRKSSRLYALWPAIEQRLAEGVSHAQLLEFLNGHGFELTERTYKTYVYRFRKRGKRSPAINPAVASAPPSSTGGARLLGVPNRGSANTMYPAADILLSAQDTSKANGAKRPATFEFNPMGISPDLLE